MRRKSKEVLISVTLVILVTVLSFVIVMAVMQRYEIEQIYSDQAKIEKRINNLTLAMQTKDKELETGMRNNYQGLIYKLDFLEKQVGMDEKSFKLPRQ